MLRYRPLAYLSAQCANIKYRAAAQVTELPLNFGRNVVESTRQVKPGAMLGPQQRRELHGEVEQGLVATFPTYKGETDRTASGLAHRDGNLRQTGVTRQAGTA